MNPEAPGDKPALVVFAVLVVLVCIGLGLEAPGVLLIVVILATPALIRTVITRSRQPAPDGSQGGMSVVATFLSSLGVVAMVGLAAGAAFYATCFVVCLGGLAIEDMRQGRGGGDWILVASVGAGLVPGVLVGGWLFGRLWSRKG